MSGKQTQRGKRARLAKLRKQLDGGYLAKPDGERTYCYCDAWGLTYPHYRAEHSQEHDEAAKVRAARAGGGS